MTRSASASAAAPPSEATPRGRAPRTPYLGFALATSSIAFLGFSFTYFGPSLRGEYPSVSPMVHLHGWTFFLWYLLLPLQAGLVAARKISLHRTLGSASIALAVAMTLTGLVVIGHQMRLALQPEGSPFWQFLGPAIFTTLALFVVFYGLALRHRRRRDLHKRLILLASTGALGAAGFRVMGQMMGFGAAAGVVGILLPNVIILAAILVEVLRGEGVHPVYRWGLPLSVAAEAGAILLTPTPAGQLFSHALAWLGVVLAPLY